MDGGRLSSGGGNENTLPVNKWGISYEAGTYTTSSAYSRNVFQPDLVYLSNKDILTERGIEGPTDLVVEIISPSNSYTDRNQKKTVILNLASKNIG